MTVYGGISGWRDAPWRGVFYPSGLRQADELSFAAERLHSIPASSTGRSTRYSAPRVLFASASQPLSCEDEHLRLDRFDEPALGTSLLRAIDQDVLSFRRQ